ncbi:MAG: hypothetical protein GF408_07990 [Candidatus Omnitrophica bacterium]|nr:hypothetical protein [Candidatus Omnitrophota bacterium]
MIREISRRGWKIGLHASWGASRDIEEMKRQKESLEKVVGKEIVSVRQHFLAYDPDRTPGIQAEAGFNYDSTMGFNDNVGFRYGTCYPWEMKEDLLEIPLLVQDGALFRSKGLGLDKKGSVKKVMSIADKVENVGGVLTLLWHPSHIVDKDWKESYIEVLSRLKERDVWFATVRDIGDHWRSLEDIRSGPKEGS